MKETHDAVVEGLEARLAVKGRDVTKFWPIRDLSGRMVSDADLISVDVRDGLTYITRYEVKTGRCGYKCAKRQAKEWLASFEGLSSFKPNFVYYDTYRGRVKRWTT